MERLLPPFDFELAERLGSIRQSISCNTTKNLYHLYIENLYRCMRYHRRKSVRVDIGIEGYLESYLTTVAAEQLLQERPIEERLKIFRGLKEEYGGMITGETFDELGEVVLLNPFNNNMLCHPWGRISKRKRLEATKLQKFLVDDFQVKFLG